MHGKDSIAKRREAILANHPAAVGVAEEKVVALLLFSLSVRIWHDT